MSIEVNAAVAQGRIAAEAGVAAGIAVVAGQIGEQQAEKALEEQNEMLRMLMDSEKARHEGKSNGPD